MHSSKKAFTLIEMMISVIIISTVILALLEMQGNTNFIFSKLKSKLSINQYLSFFIANDKYGFDKDSISLDDLISDFKVENELRRELKEIKVKVIYEELDTIDMSEMDEEDVEAIVEVEDGEVKDTDSSIVFEIGRTVLELEDSSASLMRFRIQ